MASPRRTPKLSLAGDTTRSGRMPMVPRHRREPPRNRLAWSAGISVALHAVILALMIITFPNKTPPEPPSPTAVDVVFQPGNKTPTAPKTQGPPEPARQSAPRGQASPTPQRTVQASPPPAPLPRPEIKTPVAPHQVTPPKPVPPPLPKPPPPKPVPAAPKPPPALPKINLPPPPPPAPAPPKMPPAPKPVPVPPPPVPDNEEAEVNLSMPPLPELAPMNLPPAPPLPPLPPPPQKAAPARRAAHGRSSAFSQGMVMNGMSFNGAGGSGGIGQGKSLNMSSATNIGRENNVSIKGDPGTNWISELQKWVSDRASYPEFAAEMGQQGSVTVRFTVDRAGHVSGLQMVTPTGYALLDEDLAGLFRNASLPPLTADAKSNSVTVQYTMHYVLEH